MASNHRVFCLAPKIDLLRILDDELKIDNFVLYRADRGFKGGVVATYVASNLNSKRIIHIILLPNIIFHENKTLIIGNIYRPPPAPAGCTKCILSTINSFEKHNELIILGDSNSNWLSHSSTNDRHLFIVQISLS